MKEKKRRVTSLLPLLALMSLVSCGQVIKNGEDITFDEDGNLLPSSGTTIKVWGTCDGDEKNRLTQLVASFNEQYKDYNIKAIFNDYSSNGYEDMMVTTLNGKAGPDVFTSSDEYFKEWAKYGFSTNLDPYIYSDNKVLNAADDIADMYQGAVGRYHYDPVTTRQDGDGAHYYGLPKGSGATAIYYNKTYMKNAKIQEISVYEEDLSTYNREHGTSYPARGYFTLGGKYYFNNKIAMNWEDCVALATRLKTANSAQGCTSGFLTSWWFNYGFSVGGSCIGYLTSENGGLTAEEANSYYGGYYTFTLADSTLNYRVKVDGGIDVNGNHYDNNEIVSYEDKFFMNDALADKCDILPSQRQAFTEYLSLSGKKEGADAMSFYNKGDEAGITDEFYEIVPYRLNGGQKAGILKNNELVMNKHGEIDNLGNLLSAQEKAGDLVVIKNKDVSPNPSSFSTDGRVGNFANGQVAMVVEVRACVASFRSMITDFEWDVAPMLVYREYDNNNNTVRRGIEGAHSGSACWSVWSKSTIKNAAYLFVKYVTCGEGQDYLAKAGTIIPNNKEAAKAQVNEDVTAGKSPSNLGIFLDGAEYQTPGDWWFLYDNDWIDGANCWAPKLNNYVRNYKLTLSDFYSSDDYKNTFERLMKYTEK